MPNGENGTTSTCSGTFRDGAGDYASSLNSTRTFCPSTPGDKVRITFTAFDTDNFVGCRVINLNSFLKVRLFELTL